MLSYKIEQIKKRIIDSVWVITAKIDEESGTAVILDFSRSNENGYGKEADQLRNGDVVEDTNRIVQKINIFDDSGYLFAGETGKVVKVYDVVNKRHVFDYNNIALGGE
tara:strand:+ start:9690 stop:10013 length:324 start_codon:yes stop_codon:yes gene_type:complete